MGLSVPPIFFFFRAYRKRKGFLARDKMGKEIVVPPWTTSIATLTGKECMPSAGTTSGIMHTHVYINTVNTIFEQIFIHESVPSLKMGALYGRIGTARDLNIGMEGDEAGILSREMQ